MTLPWDLLPRRGRGERLRREGKARPGRLGEPQLNAVGHQRRAGGQRLIDPVEAQHREPAAGRRRAINADRFSARRDRRACGGRRPVKGDRDDAGACGAAVLHARHDLLADKAAFLEIDAMELVHVGLMRKRIPVGEIEAAGGHAERDPMRLVDGVIDQLGPESTRRIGGAGWRDAAQSQLRQAWIG